MEEIRIFAPASVANVGPGYDTFGFAIEGLGDEITLRTRDDGRLNILPCEGADLPTNPTENVAGVAVQSLLDHLGTKQGFDIGIKKLFTPGSGLGSSASSASGSVFAANALLGNPIPTKDLLPFALEGEALASKSYHADNVAPALLGGFQVARSYQDGVDLFQLPIPEGIQVLIIFPSVQVKTAEAKGLVPKMLPMSEAREQWGNIGALIHAFHTGDYDLMRKSITDRIAEPVRKKLIPGYEEVKQVAMNCGCAGFNISGSGPTMFALFSDPQGIRECERQVKDIYIKHDLPLMVHQTKINPVGCTII